VKKIRLAALLLIPGLLTGGGSPARVHTIRMTGDPDKPEYRFAPARLTAARGDTLHFQVVSGGPHALGLDPAGLTPAARDGWNRALPGRRGLLRGPLLRNEQTYTVIVPRAAAPGTNVIFCLVHRAYDMRVEIEVR
jgi:plastocyanin